MDVDVDVDVDVVVDTTGHSLATDFSHCGLGSVLGSVRFELPPERGRVSVHVHDHVHDHVHVCDTFTGSRGR